MYYNQGWTNLIPQQLKYTPALGKAAAAKLEAGQTLTSVASELRVSRASLRNWRSCVLLIYNILLIIYNLAPSNLALPLFEKPTLSFLSKSRIGP